MKSIYKIAICNALCFAMPSLMACSMVIRNDNACSAEAEAKSKARSENKLGGKNQWTIVLHAPCGTLQPASGGKSSYQITLQNVESGHAFTKNPNPAMKSLTLDEFMVIWQQADVGKNPTPAILAISVPGDKKHRMVSFALNQATYDAVAKTLVFIGTVLDSTLPVGSNLTQTALILGGVIHGGS